MLISCGFSHVPPHTVQVGMSLHWGSFAPSIPGGHVVTQFCIQSWTHNCAKASDQCCGATTLVSAFASWSSVLQYSMSNTPPSSCSCTEARLTLCTRFADRSFALYPERMTVMVVWLSRLKIIGTLIWTNASIRECKFRVSPNNATAHAMNSACRALSC